MMILRANKLIKLLAVSAMFLLIAGCGSNELEDLKTYVTQIKARPASPIEPMPDMKAYEMYKYVSAELRNPFVKLDEPQQQDEVGVLDGPGPDLNREKEELEAYPLDTLRMVGTLSKGNQLWGLVRTNDGVIHRVQPGYYLGQNFGKIIQIQEQQIDLDEWKATAGGKWREREASLALVE